MWIEIDIRDKRPLYEQIVSRIEEMILKGVIEPNEALPSVRSLAMELSINPNTIQKAYSALESEGFTYSVSGRGSFAADVKELLPKRRDEYLRKLDQTIRQGLELGVTGRQMKERIDDQLRQTQSAPGKTKR